MKKIVYCLLVAVLAVSGCAHKETAREAEMKARKSLMEGTVYLKQGDPRKAVESFAMGIRLAPDYFESYYLLAETFLRLKQFTQAASVMAAAIRQFPDNGLAYYLLALAHEGAGNQMPAILAAKKSEELFSAQGDKEGSQRATILLAVLVSAAKEARAAHAADHAGKDEPKAVKDQAQSGAAELPTTDMPQSK